MKYMSVDSPFIQMLRNNGALHWATRQLRRVQSLPSELHLHLLIKIHISNNVSMPDQRHSQWPSIESTLGIDEIS